MLPGKTYSSAEVVRILWRRKWLLLLPTALASAGALYYASTIPNRYRSETTILVVPQRVPEAFVRSTVSQRIEDRLRTMSQEILSRTRLERIIQEFKLYPEELQRIPLEDVIGRMRTNDVRIEIARADSFRLSFSYTNARLAQRVTDRLSTLFIEDSLRDRESQAEGTSQFLEGQLEDAKLRLIEQEKRLEAYRRAHSGELPSQMASNIQAIQSAQQQLQSLTDSLNRDRDRRVDVERAVADLNAQASIPAPPVPVTPNSEVNLPIDAQVAVAEEALRSLELRLTAEHPDVVRARRRVVELKEKSKEAAQSQNAQRPSPPPLAMAPAEVARQNEIARLRREGDSLERQIATKVEEDKRLRAVLAQYQARLEAIPTRESELVELTRDYDTLQASYRSLLGKKEESRIAENLERRQIGEQFRVLDPARLPERPESPNRPLIHFGGALAGLLLGLALVISLEFSDRSFKSELDVTQALGLPVLAAIPAVASRHTGGGRRRWLIWSAAGFLVVGSAGVLLWRFTL